MMGMGELEIRRGRIRGVISLLIEQQGDIQRYTSRIFYRVEFSNGNGRI
jgi:hypothetical protein